MPSFRNYLVSWALWFMKKGSWQSAAAFDKRIAAARRKNPPHEPPEKMQKQFIVEEEMRKEGYVVYTVAPKSETPTQARIMYLHGGAFVFEIAPQHWALIAQLAERLQAVITVPIYPLGPETPLMKMYDCVQPLYNELAAEPDPTPFWCMGDSAGGTMTLVMTQNARKAGLPTARRLVPITPCTDVSLANEEMLAVAPKDPWLDVPGIKHVTELICPELPVKDPRVSPIYGDLKGPPMLVLAGGNDLLGLDAIKMAGMAKEQGSEVELLVGEGMMHVWPILPIPEAALAVNKIVEWLQQGQK
ncbi:alpha/beta hydrolase fold-domain-containing protein [Thelonectria olida]|uniref:Alpha/beta hydrolase fold-domain-containing protein n=1 Tax=Thelonectria olida TaxID=1576542 RepID=A0A9P9AQY0_9HYPO|nr:alpha/beta hydrolase fold-domain-containing protein [Thelonectria olida]